MKLKYILLLKNRQAIIERFEGRSKEAEISDILLDSSKWRAHLKMVIISTLAIRYL